MKVIRERKGKVVAIHEWPLSVDWLSEQIRIWLEERNPCVMDGEKLRLRAPLCDEGCRGCWDELTIMP